MAVVSSSRSPNAVSPAPAANLRPRPRPARQIWSPPDAESPTPRAKRPGGPSNSTAHSVTSTPCVPCFRSSRLAAVAERSDLDKAGPADRPVLVVDFGAQYAQLIARRVREARVFSEVIPHTASVEEIKARDPLAVVLSGGPASVYAEGAPQLDPAVFDLGVPVFGICYGFQAMAQALGGTVAHTGTSEYGRTELKVIGGELHSDLPHTQPVWMSHGDAVTAAPDGFEVVATSAGAPVAAFENRSRRLAGVQYPPEVMHTPHGQQVLSRFLLEFAGIAADWTPAGIAEALVEQVRNQVGDGHAICGLSGGVD